MTGSTPNRNYPFPTPDSPNKPRVDIEALALSVDADVQDVADHGLPLGGNEGDHIVLQDDGKGGLEPIWEPHKDSGGGIVDWHEIGRGEFLMSDNFVSGPQASAQLNRPTDVGKVAGHGAINATTGPMPVYHLAETDDGEGGTKLFDLSGEEFIMEESGATDYRATAIIEGNEYPVALNSSSLRVTDPDGMNTEHVSSWTFTAWSISGTAPVQVELVVEAFGEIAALPDDLVHQADLVGLASEEYVDSAVDGIEITSIDGLATVEYSDEADAEVLAKANDHSDANDAATLKDAQDYADAQDHVLTKAISDETQARVDGDAQLAQDLSDEATARAEGDHHIQQQVDGLADTVSELESVSHRGDWTFADGGADPLPGALSVRTGIEWAVAAGWKVSKVDMADSGHAFDGVKAGSIVRFEIKDGGTTIGEAFYSLDDEGNINNELSGHIQFTGTLVQSSGRFVQQDDVVHLTIVPAGSSGDIDAYTKGESDAKFLAKGSTTSIQLSDGTTKAQSSFSASNHTHSGYAASGHSHSGYASSSHKHNSDYVKGNFTITKSNGNYYIS